MIDRIKKLMDYKKLTATQFSDEIEIQRSSLSHVLSGRNNPSLDFMLKIKNAYPEIELNWLLLGEGSMIKKQPAPPPEGRQDLPVSDVEPEINFTREPQQDRTLDKMAEEMAREEDAVPYNATGYAQKPVRVMIFYANNTFETYVPKQ